MNIPGYRIVREIGRGGMATVFLAEQESLGRWVALKVMAPALAANPDFTQRFLKEARTVAQLAHPHIVAIFDVGVADNAHFVALEYVEGGDLKTRLRSGKLAPENARTIARDVATALGYAHGKGFVHRDVKPENVLFRESGSAVLTDFGIAKALGSATRMTAVGMSIGTPHYMSPEQARGQPVDPRSDLYALGIVLYEMLTGHVPYEAEDSIAVGIQHVSAPLPRLPDGLSRYQALLHRMLAKQPEQRYPDAAALVAAIEGLLGTPPPRGASGAGLDAKDGPGAASNPTVVMESPRSASKETVVMPAPSSDSAPRAADGNAHEVPGQRGSQAEPAAVREVQPKPSRAGNVVAMVVGGLLALIGVLAAIAFYNEGMHLEERWVSAVNLNVREGPSRSARVVGRVHMGEPVRVWEQVDEWVRIGRGQWVSDTFLRPPHTFRMVRGEMSMGSAGRRLPIEFELGNPQGHDAPIYGRYRYTQHGSGWLTLIGHVDGRTLVLDEYDSASENTGRFRLVGSCVGALQPGGGFGSDTCSLQGSWYPPTGSDRLIVNMRGSSHQVIR